MFNHLIRHRLLSIHPKSSSYFRKNQISRLFQTSCPRLNKNTENANEPKPQLNSKNTNHAANQPSFASLFRDSPICQLGSPEGKIVLGEIVEVVEDDLYIDFGFKFNAVCRRPKQNPLSYSRGAIVKVRINDLELSDRFLGSTKDMTLLEADVTLIGLHSTPVKIDPAQISSQQFPTSKSSKRAQPQTSKSKKISD